MIWRLHWYWGRLLCKFGFHEWNGHWDKNSPDPLNCLLEGRRPRYDWWNCPRCGARTRMPP